MSAPLPDLARLRPRLLDALQAYSGERLLRDVGAGITVGIVALPLAMAFAIASGLKPEAGIWTAILAGAIVAALGGSAVQIAGPAGAFIVIVYGIVERHGLDGLEQLHRQISLKGGRMELSGLHGQPRDLVRQSGFWDKASPEPGGGG